MSLYSAGLLHFRFRRFLDRIKLPTDILQPPLELPPLLQSQLLFRLANAAFLSCCTLFTVWLTRLLPQTGHDVALQLLQCRWLECFKVDLNLLGVGVPQ